VIFFHNKSIIVSLSILCFGTAGKPVNFPTDDSQIQAIKGAKGLTSKYIGVSFSNVVKKFVVQVRCDSSRKYLGTYSREEDAARKYVELKLEHSTILKTSIHRTTPLIGRYDEWARRQPGKQLNFPLGTP
jgi:hypothetical protein